MLELVKGLCKNKVLLTLNISRNPILPAYATIFLETIKRSPEMAIQELIMEGIVVDKDFESIQKEIQRHRMFTVKFELALPVRKTSLDQLKKEVEAPSVFNVDPLRLLYMLKEKYRAQDFFNKINRDSNEVVSRDELKYLFKDAGIPVTAMVIDKIMEFMDTNNDGEIDLSEFLEGDKKIRKLSREYARHTASLAASGESYTKYSRTFRKGNIDKMTFRLNIDKKGNPLTPIQSRDPSPSPQGGAFDF
ncbi:hypothetical protein KUTeg_024839 [Tegillarca granosa]|uniref:EF-hand domain-containing protein n=1 Tax=Tegillarca granosa TaxID=220873 RepID=A0ABQ9DYJ7_TEGGR|nr:hypothetical protein KUTeg_024839 [Tegillarca granosa]